MNTNTRVSLTNVFSLQRVGKDPGQTLAGQSHVLVQGYMYNS